jgi:serine/threonine-protein kinase
MALMAETPGNDHWRKLEELFYAALDLEPSERPAFLDRSCGADSELRREVEVLLNSSEKTWGFFQKPLQAVAEQVAQSSESAGQRLGDYKIIRLLGEGGMGKVYLAARADELYQQQVAVKLVQTGTGRAGDLFLRFRAERQILANLTHPNIARPLDAGITADGSPYLVMEYIEGTAIDKYVIDRRLSIAERLRLFREVCGAVEYAHRNLVVHRDIKPANILVTSHGVPKLLDFGIAKLLQPSGESDAALTRATERLMTPEYASPEQVRGEAVTTATDVYALGVLLYVLLAGQPPFRIATKSPFEVARIVCEQPPTRPSSVLGSNAASLEGQFKNEKKAVQGDLDNIILKALRKEPERRYASVEALSEDVRRHLEGYPVQAGSDNWRYRSSKFIARHRAGVAAAAFMTLAILTFSLGMGLFAQRARQERLKAEREKEFLSSLLEAATPEATHGKSVTVREVLDQGAKRIDQELASEPEVQAAMFDNVGNSYLALGLYDQAQPLLERAYDLRRRTLGDNNLDTAATVTALARVLEIGGQYPKAEPLFRQALAVREKLLADNHPLVGESLALLGEDLYLESRNQEAEQALRKSLSVVPKDSEIGEDSRNYLALVLEQKGNYDEAVRLLRESTDTAQRIDGGDSPNYVTSLHNLAGALSDLGNLREAEATERQVLEIRRRVSGKDHPDVAYSLNNLGWFLLEEGNWQAAAPFLQEGLELSRRTLGEKHPRVAGALNNWGHVLEEKGDYPQAEKFYQQALASLRATSGGESWSTAKVEANLAMLQLDRGDNPSAEQYSWQALEVRRKLGGDENPDVATSLIDAGVIRSFEGDLPGAEALIRQALDIRKKLLSPGHIKIVAAEVRLGEVLTAEAKASVAEPILREAVQSAHNSPFPLVAWQVAEAESALGLCLAAEGHTAEAEALIRKSRNALENHPEAALRKQMIQRSTTVLAASAH